LLGIDFDGTTTKSRKQAEESTVSRDSTVKDGQPKPDQKDDDA
jgi:hypothetical protein